MPAAPYLVRSVPFVKIRTGSTYPDTWNSEFHSLLIILAGLTWLLLHNMVYIEIIGFLAVFVEALLGMPQFIRNFRLKSTEGMSVKMVNLSFRLNSQLYSFGYFQVLLWASGDIFKTVYFIVRSAPKQFWLCGILQISIDIAILCQVIFYSTKYRFPQQ